MRKIKNAKIKQFFIFFLWNQIFKLKKIPGFLEKLVFWQKTEIEKKAKIWNFTPLVYILEIKSAIIIYPYITR